VPSPELRRGAGADKPSPDLVSQPARLDVEGYVNINRRVVPPRTTIHLQAEANHAVQGGDTLVLQGEGPTAVSAAMALAPLQVTSAKHDLRIDILFAAVLFSKNGDINFLEMVGGNPIVLKFTPSAHYSCSANEFFDGLTKLGKAGWPDCRIFSPVYLVLENQNSNIILQRCTIKLRMLNFLCHREPCIVSIFPCKRSIFFCHRWQQCLMPDTYRYSVQQ